MLDPRSGVFVGGKRGKTLSHFTNFTFSVKTGLEPYGRPTPDGHKGKGHSVYVVVPVSLSSNWQPSSPTMQLCIPLFFPTMFFKLTRHERVNTN